MFMIADSVLFHFSLRSPLFLVLMLPWVMHSTFLLITNCTAQNRYLCANQFEPSTSPPLPPPFPGHLAIFRFRGVGDLNFTRVGWGGEFELEVLSLHLSASLVEYTCFQVLIHSRVQESLHKLCIVFNGKIWLNVNEPVSKQYIWPSNSALR